MKNSQLITLYLKEKSSNNSNSIIDKYKQFANTNRHIMDLKKHDLKISHLRQYITND